MKRRLYIYIISALMINGVIGCATVPITQRQQLSFIPASELSALSMQEYQEIRATSKMSTDQAGITMVRTVGARIAYAAEQFLAENGMAADIKNYQWEFNLIEDPQVNAFCMPGGKVFVYTGILPVAENDAGLAVVMAHEIAHAMANHSGERMSQMMISELGASTLSYALTNAPAKTKNLFMLAYGGGSQLGVLLPYSRLQESEADRIGLIIMARAGYNPAAAVPFWQRMNIKGGARPPQFLSTHPAPQTRINDIQKTIPEALRYYQVKS